MSSTNDKLLCVLSAPVFNRSGYGGWSTDVAKSLLRYDKFDLKIAVQRWGHCQAKHNFHELTDELDKKLYSCVLTKTNLDRQPDVFIQMTIPEEFNPIGKYNIGITAGIETTKATGEFIEGVNRMDLTIASSNHTKNVLLNSIAEKRDPAQNNKPVQVKVEKPIEICFWGADTNIFKKTDERNNLVDEALNKIPEDFAFLFIGQYTHNTGDLFADRKDIGNLIKTFCKTFINTEKNKPCLILKSNTINFSSIDRFRMLNLINSVRQSVGPNAPNVYLLHGELTDDELNALFNHPKIKCHVSFTHGEGYGHPLLLQTLSGKPLFVSNWSGHLDFLNPEYANLLPGTIGKINPASCNKYYLPDSEWFTVSYNLAEEKLRNIHMNYTKEKLQRNAELLREENSKKFNLSEMDKQLWGILDKYIPVFSSFVKFSMPEIK